VDADRCSTWCQALIAVNSTSVRIIVDIIHGFGIFAIVFTLSSGVKFPAHLDYKWAISNHSTPNVVITRVHMCVLLT
jgi:hypothetical protein